MGEHRCEAMGRALRDNSIFMDELLIHHHRGSRPETSRWYLTLRNYDGITDIPDIRYCPFCGVELPTGKMRIGTPPQEWQITPK